MAELRPIPFADLLYRLLHELERQESLFDLPSRKFYRPKPGLDLSVDVHGHRAQTPVGPAAGPHAQLAQNIVLSWLAGSRVIELKTVQVLDELKIPRPCIDAATIGFNVEWSQELKLNDSLREYVKGAVLIEIARQRDLAALGQAAAQAAPVFELSVGYDLKGLESPAMRAYLAHVRDVADLIAELRREGAPDLAYPTELVSCVTLSTFHGCPPQEIDAIARYLMGELGFDVIVKLNPTLLGLDTVHELLSDRLGYTQLRPKASAFAGDLQWNEAVTLGRGLADFAKQRGKSFGVKMTNTLVVENHKKFFPVEEMYLSGEPLHVLAMHCVERWRAAFGGEIPLSFSGGIDQHNFADAVACDLVPVTTCTDLLRPGGYGRLPKYLENLEQAMIDCGARNRDELILKRFGKEAEAGGDVGRAAQLNTRDVVAKVTADPRYAAAKNAKPPRKVGSQLVLLDCLSCDKCVPVCPNDANFSIATPVGERSYEDIVLAPDGTLSRVPGGVLSVKKPEQWANFADACNDCGNCDVFCPEDGGPQVMKARFFGSRASFDASPHLDGIFIAAGGRRLHVHARMAGRTLAIDWPLDDGERVLLDDGMLRAQYDRRTHALVDAAAHPEARGPHRLSGAWFVTLHLLVEGALKRMNPVSAAIAAD